MDKISFFVIIAILLIVGILEIVFPKEMIWFRPIPPKGNKVVVRLFGVVFFCCGMLLLLGYLL